MHLIEHEVQYVRSSEKHAEKSLNKKESYKSYKSNYFIQFFYKTCFGNYLTCQGSHKQLEIRKTFHLQIDKLTITNL